ncbi:unnamed protein product [Rhodiola kirilowii]
MAVPAAIAIVPIGILFILSGIIVNCIQAVVYILVRPLWKNLYRRINKVVAELLWLELIWLIDWWAGTKVEVYADEQTLELMGKEHALFISNHRSDVDWLVGWVLAQRSGCLGSALAIMKKSSKFLPIIGWSMWFSDYIFLERRWAKDENTLEEAFKRLEDFPRPFWLALFVEGTRFTQEKLIAAQQYATCSGLPIPRNVLIPRTKGFVSAVENLRSFVPAIYDATVAVSKTQPPPTMLRMLKGQSSVIKVHIKRHPLKELPETSAGISQWCKAMFISKDAFLEDYFKTDRFNDHDYHDIGRPVKSLLVVTCWSCLLMLGIYGLLEWSSLPTWETLMFGSAFLIVVTIIMQILITFTISERSNPPNLPQTTADPAREILLHK